MNRARTFVGAVCAAAVVSASLLIGPALHAQAGAGVVISEFRFRGPNGASDEFIELYNNSPASIDISGWKIWGSNDSAATSSRLTIATNTILKPGCYFLATNSSSSGGPYSGSVPGDQTYTTGITDTGGIALIESDATIVDQVGLSAGSAYREGSPLPNLGTTSASNLNRGYERISVAVATYKDSGNNSADFLVRSPSNPQSKAQCSTDPTGVGSAVPGALDPGQATLLTVKVTP